jgi:hypothetical protein
LDPESEIRDPEWVKNQDPGSGINIPDPQHYFRLTMKEEKSVRNDRSFTVIEANKSGIKFRNKKLDQLVSGL